MSNKQFNNIKEIHEQCKKDYYCGKCDFFSDGCMFKKFPAEWDIERMYKIKETKKECNFISADKMCKETEYYEKKILYKKMKEATREGKHYITIHNRLSGGLRQELIDNGYTIGFKHMYIDIMWYKKEN